MKTLDTIGGRRFLMALLFGLVASGLQAWGKLDPAGTAYAIIIVGVVAAFITGSTVEHIKVPKIEP